MKLCMKRKAKLLALPAYTALAFAAALASMPTVAMELDSGNPDMTLRWDNTVKYSASIRAKDADPTLADPFLPGAQGTGDSKFQNKGLNSSRFDLLSELEGKTNDFGFRVSAAAWNDSRYLDQSKFSAYTRETHGRKTELLDAFVSSKFNLGEHATTVRVGQHSNVWGETIFFGDNGIAGLMSPIDVAKALSVPNLRFQEILRPVPQVSGQVQLNSEVSLYSFYQTKWVENRSQGADSYFSPFGMLPGGDITASPLGAFTRSADQNGSNSGQGGLALKIADGDTDYGLYFVRANSKSATTVTQFGSIAGQVAANQGPLPQGTLGSDGFYRKYHNGITSIGASANRSIGKFNYGIEASVRNNQDLLSLNAYDMGAGAKYATGKTFHLNLSAFGTSMGKTALWNDALLIGEVAFNRVLSVKENADTLSGCMPALVPPLGMGGVCAPNGTRDSTRMQVLFEPVWFQAFDGVDIRMPMGLSYQFKGSRNMVGPAPMTDGGGSVNIGVSGSYLDVWRFGISRMHYLGDTKPLFGGVAPGNFTQQFNYGQPFGDRDYTSLYVTRTF